MVAHFCLRTTLSMLVQYVYDFGPAITSSSMYAFLEYSSSHMPKPLPNSMPTLLRLQDPIPLHRNSCEGLFSLYKSGTLPVSQNITCDETNRVGML